jgi:hypothetical protein
MRVRRVMLDVTGAATLTVSGLTTVCNYYASTKATGHNNS